MRLLAKIPPVFSVPLFYTTMSVAMFLKFLFGSLGGAFLLSAATFAYFKYFADVWPYSASELLFWIDGLDKEYKVALLSSVVTIAGFIIAFHTATLNWKSQMLAQLKSQVAGEIEEFFAQITTDINSARIYAELLVRTVEEIQKGCSVDDALFKIQYIKQKTNVFIATRDRLSLYSVEIHRLLGKNYNILSSGWKLIENMESATNALMPISEKMWINVPIIDIENPNYTNLFIKHVNVTGCNDFIQVCNENYNKINYWTGSVRGYLLSPIIGFNFFSYLTLLSIKGSFWEMIKKIHLEKKKNS